MDNSEWLSQYKEQKFDEYLFNPYTIVRDEWLLISSGDDKSCNSMTARWGGFDYFLRKPCTSLYVGQTRYTKEFLDKYKTYSVCVFEEKYKDKLQFMGEHSGRDMNKYEKTGLNPVYIDNTIAIKEAKIIFLCKKLCVVDIPYNNILQEDVRDTIFNKNDPLDFVTMYMGEITKILIKK